MRTTGAKPTKDEEDEMIAAVRDTVLDQLCAGLRRMGNIPEAKIIEARKQCVAQDSDAPLLALVRRR